MNFELDKLMIWLPAPCAIAIAKDMANTSSFTSTNYKVERGCVDPSSDRRFSFYCVNVPKLESCDHHLVRVNLWKSGTPN